MAGWSGLKACQADKVITSVLSHVSAFLKILASVSFRSAARLAQSKHRAGWSALLFSKLILMGQNPVDVLEASLLGRLAANCRTCGAAPFGHGMDHCLQEPMEKKELAQANSAPEVAAKGIARAPNAISKSVLIRSFHRLVQQLSIGRSHLCSTCCVGLRSTCWKAAWGLVQAVESPWLKDLQSCRCCTVAQHCMQAEQGRQGTTALGSGCTLEPEPQKHLPVPRCLVGTLRLKHLNVLPRHPLPG